MSEKFETITIPVSRAKFILLAIVALLFVIAGCYMITIGDTTIGILSIVFFGGGMIPLSFKVVRLIKDNKGLLIDNRGITNYTDANLSQTIMWEDIQFAEIGKIYSNKMLLIFVYNPEEYINKESKLQKQGLKNNYALSGTPFVIPSSILACKLEYLRDEINKRNNIEQVSYQK